MFAAFIKNWTKITKELAGFISNFNVIFIQAKETESIGTHSLVQDENLQKMIIVNNHLTSIYLDNNLHCFLRSPANLYS